MINRLDDLYQSTATDGAFSPIGALRTSEIEGDDALLDAWLDERREHIETYLYLDQACQLLSRMMSEGTLSVESRRRVRDFQRAIRASRADGRGSA